MLCMRACATRTVVDKSKAVRQGSSPALNTKQLFFLHSYCNIMLQQEKATAYLELHGCVVLLLGVSITGVAHCCYYWYCCCCCCFLSIRNVPVHQDDRWETHPSSLGPHCDTSRLPHLCITKHKNVGVVCLFILYCCCCCCHCRCPCC